MSPEIFFIKCCIDVMSCSKIMFDMLQWMFLLQWFLECYML